MSKVKFKRHLPLFIICQIALIIYSSSICVLAYDNDEVSIGGFPFGLRVYTDGVYVSEVSTVLSHGKNLSPGKTAGLEAGDTIIKINGKKVDKVSDVSEIISRSKGNTLSIVVKRNNDIYTKTLIPILSDEKGDYKSGLFIRDSASGIGTVSFITENGYFAGLGHGVCDFETSKVIPMKSGDVYSAEIEGVNKSEKGVPGELVGNITSERIGSLSKNSERGVFGKLDKMIESEKIKIAYPKVGDCKILTTLKGNKPEYYNGRITEIIDLESKTKNFVIELTDSEALGISGGIVQGMSGSPIIQNGCIVGAVTHVLIDTPKLGYGITIYNMLEEMKKCKAYALHFACYILNLRV